MEQEFNKNDEFHIKKSTVWSWAIKIMIAGAPFVAGITVKEISMIHEKLNKLENGQIYIMTKIGVKVPDDMINQKPPLKDSGSKDIMFTELILPKPLNIKPKRRPL